MSNLVVYEISDDDVESIASTVIYDESESESESEVKIEPVKIVADYESENDSDKENKEEVNRCCCCGDECNPQSQMCGACSRSSFWFR